MSCPGGSVRFLSSVMKRGSFRITEGNYSRLDSKYRRKEKSKLYLVHYMVNVSGVNFYKVQRLTLKIKHLSSFPVIREEVKIFLQFLE